VESLSVTDRSPATSHFPLQFFLLASRQERFSVLAWGSSTGQIIGLFLMDRLTNDRITPIVGSLDPSSSVSQKKKD
jgi:hypothetical protein